MRKRASTAPEFDMSRNALLLIGVQSVCWAMVISSYPSERPLLQLVSWILVLESHH
jgi:hypothetical protein